MRKPFSVKLLTFVCILQLIVMLVTTFGIYLVDEDAFKSFLWMGIIFCNFQIFILLGMWRRSAESVRLMSIAGTLYVGWLLVAFAYVAFADAGVLLLPVMCMMLFQTTVAFRGSVRKYVNRSMNL